MQEFFETFLDTRKLLIIIKGLLFVGTGRCRKGCESIF